jgi:hypothetical protein
VTVVVIQAVVVATASWGFTTDSVAVGLVGLVDGSLDVVGGVSDPGSLDAADDDGISFWMIADVCCVSAIAGLGREGAPKMKLGLRWIGGMRM